jgi:hypothetical protein
VPLFWAGGYVAFSDDIDMLKGSCGKSLAPFPRGNNATSYLDFSVASHLWLPQPAKIILKQLLEIISTCLSDAGCRLLIL